MTENTMLKTKKRSYKVNSTLGKSQNKNSYILPNEGNSAEKTYDFHTAVKRIAINLSKNEGYDDQLLKLLLDKKVIQKTDLVI
jgi:hypothetical protein